jgi:hypothetical protein
MNTEEFIKSAKNVHGELYDYSNSLYVNSKTKLKIYCRKHDLEFEQTPHNHINKKNYCKDSSITFIELTDDMVEMVFRDDDWFYEIRDNAVTNILENIGAADICRPKENPHVL